MVDKFKKYNDISKVKFFISDEKLIDIFNDEKNIIKISCCLHKKWNIKKKTTNKCNQYLN